MPCSVPDACASSACSTIQSRRCISLFWSTRLPCGLFPEKGTQPNVFYVPPFNPPKRENYGKNIQEDPRMPLDYLIYLFGPEVKDVIARLEAELGKAQEGGHSEALQLLIGRDAETRYRIRPQLVQIQV